MIEQQALGPDMYDISVGHLFGGGVYAGLPDNSMKEFIAYAKSRPGVVNYGSGGSGSALHLDTELRQLTAGFTMLHVPYKGSGPGVAALLAGKIRFLLAGISTVRRSYTTGSFPGTPRGSSFIPSRLLPPQA